MNQSQNVKKPTDQNLQRLAILLELERRLRQAETESALAFLLVNETSQLASYRQAVLWQHDQQGRGGRVVGVSGLAVPDQQAPFTLWISKVAGELTERDAARAGRGLPQPQPLTSEDLPQELGCEWDGWLPAHGLWLPIQGPGHQQAGLLLAREQRWHEYELRLLSYLADAAQHAWQAQQARPGKGLRRFSLSGRKTRIALVLLVLLLGFYPVPQSALAPAEIIARNPTMVRAPLEGVVDSIAVRPNQNVNAGDLLFELDSRELQARLDVGLKTLSVAEAELRQAQQQSFADTRANATLAVLRGRVNESRTEVEYLQELVERIRVRAERGGIVIFDNVNDWLGRPVNLGERIMMLADPGNIELEMWVPVSDAITFTEGSRVRFFLNSAPQAPVEAELSYASYQADITPEGTLAYRLVAQFPADSEAQRIGLKGTAKLYGERTLLLLYVLRRPLQAFRQFFGI